MAMIKYIFVFLFMLAFLLPASAQTGQKRKFQNFNEGGALIRCFFQDYKGVVWVGISDGLGMYNGKGIQKHQISNGNAEWINFGVYCSLKQDDTHYYLGTEKGLVLFDIEKNTFQRISSPDISIRTLQWINDSVMFLGTLNGLVKYDVRLNSFQQENKIPQLPIDPIVQLDHHRFLIANYHGLYLYDNEKNSFKYLPITSQESPLILSITVDLANQWVWIGTESGLWKYNIASSSFTKVSALGNNIIKNIHIASDASLWLGTDSGLYIYDWQSDTYEYIVHNSLNNKSLVNNIIWSIFEDKEQNIWLGTESGISVYQNSPLVETYSWDSLVGSNEGNNIYCIYRDSRNNYWWGGNNGLGYYNAEKNKSLWYKMGQKTHSISHNRIRHIYEDWDGDLWVATDGGINRFDYKTETFENYQIVDAAQTLNANWAYYINGDGHDNLYVVAYCGGVFVVNKKELLAQKGKTYICKESYHQQTDSEGLHSNFIIYSTMDNNGCLWIGTDERFLNKIDFKAHKVYSYDLSDARWDIPSGSIKKIMHDSSGNVWIALNSCLCKVSSDHETIEVVHTSIFNNEDIRVIEDAEECLWIATSHGVYTYDKSAKRFTYTGIGGSYLSLYHNVSENRMWIGGIDQCLAFNISELLQQPQRSKGNIELNNLYINEQPVHPHTAYNGNLIADRSINTLDGIHLTDNQNNIALEFLYTQYNQILKPRYIYRLKGEDENWRSLEDLNTRISYTNLKPGDYVFELKEQAYEEGGEEDRTDYQLNILIDQPWYWSLWAKSAYFLLVCLLILWIVKYFHEKNRFRIEHIEREKTLELSNLKMEFLTNMSHELKTPLSLIIGPISKLLSETKNTQLKEKLSLIHSNALKLNSIIHQILDIKDWTGVQQQFHPSQLELVTFVGSIVKGYQENMKNRGTAITFHCDTENCFAEVDIPKMEAIVNNLLSNACKFSAEKGEINVYLSVAEGDADSLRKVCLKVTDNGVGIPAADLPHIFERFYQADKYQSMNKDGSGVGLSIVKSYVELHGGEIRIASEEGKGTAVHVSIPLTEIEKQVYEKTSSIWSANEPRYKVLIVEDNVEIAHFIMNNLPEAECLIAYNGKIGMEMAQQHLPDIIIADIMMPVLNGLEMAKQLKANIHTSTIPLIMLTAKDDKKTEYDLLSLGVEAFIAKPFDMKELTIHIDRILQNKHKLVRKLKEEGIIIESEPVAVESPDEKFLKYITEIIEQNLSSSDLNVTKLSELSGYTAKQIYRRLKSLTGCTAVDYIKGVRIKKAAMLLAQKQFMVSEVMYMVGYSDSSYFSKCFVEKYGMTPKQYMESRG